MDPAPSSLRVVRAWTTAIALMMAAGFHGQPTYSETTGLSALGALGKAIFLDPSLSGSGRLSCASCHSPAHAYGPPNALAVQLGGLSLDRQGARCFRRAHDVTFLPRSDR